MEVCEHGTSAFVVAGKWNAHHNAIPSHTASASRLFDPLLTISPSLVVFRKLFEDRDTILELTAKIQNEINCMNDSRVFKEAESVRSGQSHVTSQLVSFPPHPIPVEC